MKQPKKAAELLDISVACYSFGSMKPGKHCNMEKKKKQPKNPMLPRRFSKVFIKDLREQIETGEHLKYIQSGRNNVVFKDTRTKDGGANLKLRLSKSGIASFFILERHGGGGPSTFNIAGIDADLDAVTARAQQMQSNIVRGLDPDHSDVDMSTIKLVSRSPTLRQIYNERLKYPGNAKPGTVDEWEKHFKKLGAWQDKRIEEITRQQVLNKIDKLADKYTPPVADRVIKFISMLVNRAMNHPEPHYEQPTRNIVAQTLKHDKPFKSNGGKSRRISKMFPIHTWPKIWQAINDLAERVPERQDKKSPTLARTAHYYFKFCMLSGMRDGTVKTIEWHQVNIEDGTLSWISGSDVAKKKIDQQVFDLPICDYLWDMLKEMRELEIEKTGKEPRGYLFKSLGLGKLLHVDTGMPHQWRIVRSQVGPAIAKMRVYDFRATFITVADELGIGTQLTKSLIDHKENKNNVLEGYKDRGTPLKRRTANQIADHILEGMGAQEKKEEPEAVPVSSSMFERVQKEAEKTGKTIDEVLEHWSDIAAMLDKLNSPKGTAS